MIRLVFFALPLHGAREVSVSSFSDWDFFELKVYENSSDKSVRQMMEDKERPSNGMSEHVTYGVAAAVVGLVAVVLALAVYRRTR